MFYVEFFYSVKNVFMKKLISFILIVFMISLTLFIKNGENPLFFCEKVYKTCFVVDESIKSDDMTTCGNKNFLSFNRDDGYKFIKSGTNVDAMQFYLRDITLDYLLDLLKVSIIEEQNVDNFHTIYGYSPYYQECIFIDDKKVNVQIVTENDVIIAGFPLILTGY